MATLGIPGSPGVAPGAVADTLVAPYNDAAAASALVEAMSSELAAIIVEPVAANMGLVLPQPGWLGALRSLADESGALLVFDEVVTGFRLGPGGAQERFGLKADIVLLGKVLGGGLPVAAIAGSADVLEQLAPTGAVYQAGTLSGNPLAMAAGIATLGIIRSDAGLYERLQQTARSLVTALVDQADRARVPMSAAAVGGLAGFFFSQEEVVDYEGAKATDAQSYARFWRGMLERGFYLPPSRFEALFLSTAHTSAHVDRFADAAAEVLTSL
jgi:glutamate-1-semialdehyde 2,1-aminomutase